MSKLSKKVDESIAGGWKMTKLISPSGFFTRPLYDDRVAFTREEVFKLSKEGFILDQNSMEIALNILNIILKV